MGLPAVETKAGFARRVNLSPQRITQLVERGMPVREDGKIDVAEASAWMDENIDPSRRGKGKIEGKGGPTVADAKRVAMTIRARREQLALQRETGTLIEREKVERVLFERARGERDAWIGWASRIAAPLAAELGADAAATFAALDRLVREHLIELSETPHDRL